MNNPFDPQTLAGDLMEVRRIYAGFFDGLTEANWERRVKGKPHAWNLHETVAHLCALSCVGLQSIQATLQGDTYVFTDLENRYQFNAFNQRGIHERLSLPRKALCAEWLHILDRSAEIACTLQPGQAELAAEMPIYNRPVRIIEALSILMFHAGLHHTAQVAEPAGVPPLWKQLSPEIRHRVIGRVMRAFSLLYRRDLGGDLRAVFAFQVDGEGGGNWHVDVSPEMATSEEGGATRPSLSLQLRETDIFCQMLTGRMNLPIVLLTGQLKLRGDLRLFLRMGSLFSVDARQ